MKVDYAARLKSLQQKYGTRTLAKKLKVSERTVYNYLSGKTTPKQKVKSKINYQYRYAKNGGSKTRYASIYEYLRTHKSLMKTSKYQVLLDMADNNMMVSWKGSAHIPLEVKFCYGREELNDYGTRIHLIGVTTKHYLTRLDTDEHYADYIDTYTTWTPKFGKSFEHADYKTRMNILRQEFFSYIKDERSNSIMTEFLGYYFDEGTLR